MGENFRRSHSGSSAIAKIYPTPRSVRARSSWMRFWRYWYVKLLRLRGHPKEIARGFSLGVFAGCFPFFGLQTIVGILLAIAFRGNKIAAAAGTWISNPLTYIPLFAFNYQIGKRLLGEDNLAIDPNSFQQNWQSWTTLSHLGYVFILKLLLGSLVVGLLLSFVSYFVSLKFLRRWHRIRRDRRRRHRT